MRSRRRLVPLAVAALLALPLAAQEREPGARPQAGRPDGASDPVTVPYRGRSLRSDGSPGGRAFLDTMRRTIDLAETLPPDLARLARLVTDLRFDPGLRVAGTGELTGDLASGTVSIAYPDMFRAMAPAGLALGLVSAGYYVDGMRAVAEADRALAEARWRGDAAAAARAEVLLRERRRLIDPQGDPASLKRSRCDLLDRELRAMTALAMDAAEINRRTRSRSDLGCG